MLWLGLASFFSELTWKISSLCVWSIRIASDLGLLALTFHIWKGLCFCALKFELLCVDWLYIGFMCNCVLPATINATRFGNNRVNQDKSCEAENEKKKLTSVSSRERSTIATPSSSSSSPSVQVRGRSRKRRPRALQPSSPLTLGSSSVWL